VIAVACFVLLALSTASASAALTHPFVSSFGPGGPGVGTFANPQSVAVDAEGDVYVYDAGAEEGSIYKFDAAGKPINFSGLAGNVITKVGFKGADEEELAVSAAGPAKGDIFIANGHFVGVYNAAGEKLSELTEPGEPHPWGEPCGVAVDPAGNVFVGLEPSHVNEYTPTGAAVTNANYVSSLWSVQTVCNIAADSAGVYVDTWSEGPVNQFPALTFSETKPLVEEEHTLVDAHGSTLAVNPSTGNLFIDERSDVAQYEGAGPFKRLGNSGVAELGALHESFGVAASGAGAAERVYASSTTPSGVVDIYGAAVPAPPTIEPEEAEHVRQTTATIKAKINPHGPTANYNSESGERPKTGAGIRHSDEDIGSGEEPVPVKAELTSLKPGTTYHYRVVAVSSAGPVVEPDQTLTTLPIASIDSESISSLRSTSVTLDAKINPLGNDTHYYFQYGPEDCAEHACTDLPKPPGPDLGPEESDQPASALLQGLTQNTTYHYRVIATNTIGTTDGPDQTFTTYPAPPSTGACPNEQLRAENGSLGLPDCRVYELVSPPEKNGGAAGGSSRETPSTANARADGSAVFYGASAPLPGAVGGELERFIAIRSPEGWTSRAAFPRVHGEPGLDQGPTTELPSADLSHIFFAGAESFVAGDPPTEKESGSIYLAGEDPAREPEWVGRPTVADPQPALGGLGTGGQPVVSGGSADLSKVYFTYYGTLVPEDTTRALVFDENPSTHREEVSEGGPWGFYEWTKTGGLRTAGVLPDGTVSPLGALPAATLGVGAPLISEYLNSQVSDDGSRAFFVSPDPEFCGHEPEPLACVGHPTELYAREAPAGGDVKSVLLSRDQEGKAAVHGPLAVRPPENRRAGEPSPYMLASPDGSQAFFQSVDALAPGAPVNELPKEYDYELNTATLSYLPGVTGTSPTTRPSDDSSVILASSSNGSRFLYAKAEPAKGRFGRQLVSLDLWERLPGGQQRTSLVSLLPQPAGKEVDIPAVRAIADGSVFVFETDSQLPGALNAQGSGPANNAGGFEQVYRYDVASGSLLCVSCAPAGVTPSGDARLSEDDSQGGNGGPGGDAGVGLGTLAGSRGLSADGSRVFFDTTEALVPQDINGKRDVYEWESNQIHLISSGTSPNESFFLDNSASGEDVFFSTTQGLVHQDTDGGYDIYDARAGVPPALTAPACSGTGCQGVPAAPPIFATPSSVTFNGAGNFPPSTGPVVKPLTRAQLLTRALRACHSKRNHRKRAACEHAARKRYASKANKTSRRGS